MALNKITIERNQRILLDLVAQPGNDVCADCKVKNPRWASHSLGIFICVSCASVHRKIGTHVSKVKSLTMDSWTKEQTEVGLFDLSRPYLHFAFKNMKNNGNIKSNLFYNPNETRHPPPPNLMDGERDSEMEQFIRSKYEYKSFIDRSALVASKLGPSRSASSVSPRPAPAPSTASSTLSNSSSASKPPSAPPVRSATTLPVTKAPPPRTSSQPVPAALPLQPQASQQIPPQQQQQQPGGVWNDLVSLQAPASSSSLPLQFQASPAPLQGYGQQQPMNMNTGYQPQMTTPMGIGMGVGMGGGVMSANSYQSQFTPPTPYSAPMQSQFTPSFSSPSFGGGGPPAPPLYNPQPQPFAPQQQLFQGQPIQSQGSPGPQGYGFQQPGPSMTPTFGNQMLGSNQFGTPSPQPFMSSSPQPQVQYQQQAGQFMGSSPQPPFQQYGGGMQQVPQQQAQPWAAGAPMGYFPQQQQQGQWGGM
ncbi:hypothetical protein B0H13DRAFT_2209080 [Mycena leptocephala]|nr:hypothetical protein B0H13DRAFT_2209080 [Mycena leptocephala]